MWRRFESSGGAGASGWRRAWDYFSVGDRGFARGRSLRYLFGLGVPGEQRGFNTEKAETQKRVAFAEAGIGEGGVLSERGTADYLRCRAGGLRGDCHFFCLTGALG